MSQDGYRFLHQPMYDISTQEALDQTDRIGGEQGNYCVANFLACTDGVWEGRLHTKWFSFPVKPSVRSSIPSVLIISLAVVGLLGATESRLHNHTYK